jgi:hypothetical protein
MRRYLRLQSACLLLLCLVTAVSLLTTGCDQSWTDAILSQEASGYGFSLTAWHIHHLPIKLTQAAVSLAVPPPARDDSVLDDFFELGDELARLQAELRREVSQHGAQSAELASINEEIQDVEQSYRALAPQAEAHIEREITLVLTSEGFGSSLAHWDLVFPPVVFVFQVPPYVLVLSPRDRVERLDDMLLSPDVTLQQVEALESAILQSHDLSALVVSLGGISTYPAIVTQSANLRNSVFLAAHEWSHHYLFFHPLGSTYYQSGVMQEINETVADIIGREIADRIYPPPIEEPLPDGEATAGGEALFDFQAEMRHTRATLDNLLSEGSIEEAEQYLEQRRQVFVNEGYYIRKLNQAYFAFHGTYALSPASVSPVGEQLEELRGYYDSLGDFVRAVQELSTHGQLLELLAENRAD